MALDTNLVSYWKLDESSGNAADSVGSNTGTVTNISYGAAKINNGATGNGSTSLINFGSSTGLKLAGDLTITFWFKINTNQDGYVFSRTRGTSPFGMYLAYYASSTTNFSLGIYNSAGGSVFATSGTVLSTGTWYFYAGRISGTSMSCSINAGTPGTATFSGTRATFDGDTAAFARPTDSAVDFAGMLDEIGIWSRALSDAEITSLYNGGSGLQYPFTTNYPMTADTGTFTLTGQTANLLKGSRLTAELGTFSLTGIAANFMKGFGMVASAGTYTLTGINAGLLTARKLTADAGSYVLTGIAVAFQRGYGIVASAGSYILTGINAILRPSNIWRNDNKNSSTFTSQTKNSSTWTEENSNDSNWQETDKTW